MLTKKWRARRFAGCCGVERLEGRTLLSANFFTVHSFAGGRTDGNAPTGGVVADAQGDLFGVTLAGGSRTLGTLYEIPAGTNAVTILHSFTGGADGSLPSGLLTIDGQGNLFGVTLSGGAFGQGTVWEFQPQSGVLTTLHAFAPGEGTSPNGSLAVDAAGDLFGSTSDAGTGFGNVFQISGGVFRQLYAFRGLTDGQTPGAVALGPNGTIYGEAQAGTVANFLGQGNVFRMNPLGAGQPTILTELPNPRAVHVDSAGNLFALTDTSVVEILNGRAGVVQLADLSGVVPAGAVGGNSLTEDAAGNLFFTATSGSGDTLLELPVGSATPVVLQSFAPLGVAGGLTVSASGTVFGVSQLGGTAGRGILFGVSTVASQLAFANNPANVAIGAAQPKPIRVLVQDAAGRVVKNSRDTVTLTLQIFQGTKFAPAGVVGSVAAVNGVATFAGIRVKTPGIYRLVATGIGATAVSANFSVGQGAIQPPPHFELTSNARVWLVNAKNTVTVRLLDQNGKPVTKFSPVVTLTLSGSGVGELNGRVTATAAHGAAIFRGLSISQGGNYVITASSTGLIGGELPVRVTTLSGH
ncbi:MAG: choice-of-anchor tandem repeat GloVer-containing protein [Phycisphaerae bacterium]